MAERQSRILENGYYLRSTSNGLVRTDWNKSQKHVTQSLTPALGRRSYGDHPKFPNGKSMASRRWETGWKYTAQKWQVCLMPKHKRWCSASGHLRNWWQTNKVNFWLYCDTTLPDFPRGSMLWTTVDFLLIFFVFLPVRVKHREDSSLLKHVFSF